LFWRDPNLCWKLNYVDICFNENNKSLKTSVELSLISKNVRVKFKI
jgi:hypothetical protein